MLAFTPDLALYYNRNLYNRNHYNRNFSTTSDEHSEHPCKEDPLQMSETKAEICFLRRNRTPYGGAERYLARLSTELSEQGYRHRLVYSRLPAFLPSFLRVLLFNIAVCLQKGNKFYFSLERISCPDIYRAGDGVHREFLLRKGRSFNLLNPLYLYLEKRCFNNARYIIANSQMVKDQIKQHYAIGDEKIGVIYSGVEMDDPGVAAGSVRSKYSIAAATPLILFVGSGFQRKGVSEMLQLLAKLDGDFFAIIVGKDKQLKRYMAQSEQLGLAGKVSFTGPVDDIERYCSLFDDLGIRNSALELELAGPRR